MRIERSEGRNLVVRRSWGIGAAIVAALVLPAVGVLAGVALASSAFEDVDPDGVHAEGIEWLAESGVTAGCEAGRFCPNDAVTREQMGTFLYRVSGNDRRVAPSVNAATLQGLTVQELFDAFLAGELPELPEPWVPGDPDDPSDPSDPSDPGDPDDPSDPGDPDDPSDPSDPDAPDDDEVAELTERVEELELSLAQVEQSLQVLDILLDADIEDLDGSLTAAVLSLNARVTTQAETIDRIGDDLSVQQQTIDQLTGQVGDVQDQADSLDAGLGEFETLFEGVERLRIAGRDTLQFSAMNVRIVNGTGTTNGLPNGLGNLIVGYDRERTAEERSLYGDNLKSGSHYVVVGDGHNYVSFGGVLAGRLNTATGQWASVTGGSGNQARGIDSAVTGGFQNSAIARGASVTGGSDNTANGDASVVAGGWSNSATGERSAVSGGSEGEAQGIQSSVSGGQENLAAGNGSSVSGGLSNEAGALQSSVSGGRENRVTGRYGSLLGGRGEVVSVQDGTG